MDKSVWKRIAQVAVIVAPPLMAMSWSSHRAAAMREERKQASMMEMKEYGKRALERDDLRRRLVVGARFPWPGSWDAQGRPTPVGNGVSTVVFFANACATCQVSESWKLLSQHFTRAQIITIFVDSAASVKSVSRTVADARLRFVSDPRGGLHQKYGAHAQRAFVVDRGGLIVDKLGPWTRADQFQQILQQRQQKSSLARAPVGA